MVTGSEEGIADKSVEETSKQAEIRDVDEFGLPKRPPVRPPPKPSDDESEGENEDTFHDAEAIGMDEASATADEIMHVKHVAIMSPELPKTTETESSAAVQNEPSENVDSDPIPGQHHVQIISDTETTSHLRTESEPPPPYARTEEMVSSPSRPQTREGHPIISSGFKESPIRKRGSSSAAPAVSEWSHQRLAPQLQEASEDEEEEEWQAMPALGEYDIYNDEGRIVAKANKMEADEAPTNSGLGGASKGYTRVLLDEDAQSATSLDEDTSYLFKEVQANYINEEEDQRDAPTQLQETKSLLTEGQRIAYVGVTRLTIYKMLKELEELSSSKATKKDMVKAIESMEKWGQQMMVRLYAHMEISSAEQVMIEQLAEHEVQPTDLVPPLMRRSTIHNPLANPKASKSTTSLEDTKEGSSATSSVPPAPTKAEDEPSADAEDGEMVPEIQTADQIPHTEQVELDLRWTVLCDLFLLLISDGVYDSRSRFLLEGVGKAMDVSWVQICRFEKRVMDALEMQEEASGENWNESENMEKRRKLGLKHKYMVMGLATIGGGLVIGLSAGLAAPLIGTGLAAGFTTIGITGTAGFLGGGAAAAIITSVATAAGGTIAVRASNRRTGHVKTFEYRPLHNNKRLNLILTVSGWMTGKVDDVRLPYSTVDPIMGDIYSLLWEPEMLQSMGDTINILATEALTQTIQQVLGSTLLIGLMASIQLPVVLTKLAYLIDNPWTVSLDRANTAGQILADSLIDRHLGRRPITLIGFSLGSRLLMSCLKELANRRAYGLVQNVYVFGSPVVAKKDDYIRARSVISGRFVNGFASNDWILGYLFRATSGGVMKVAGLAPVEGVPGLENIDCTALVKGHMAYRTAMPRLLREVGWEVESDEFSEIEDPDPENHQRRQRELIQEIDDARKQAEVQTGKRRFGLFKRGKLAEKRTWETYDADKQGLRNSNIGSKGGTANPGLEANVLFDIDAIRRELESEMIDVRELNSTLPPMRISTLKDETHGSTTVVNTTELLAEEVAALKLPPRPDQIRDDHIHSSATNGTMYKKSPATTSEPDYEFDAPRELESTLPPLHLTPSLPQHSLTATPAPVRPDLKSHATAPAPSPTSWNAHALENAPATTHDPPTAAINLEKNAWADADDEDNVGKEEEELKMTFE